jgi:hypothetical protein
LDPGTQIMILKTDALQRVSDSTLSFVPLVLPASPAHVDELRARLVTLADQLNKAPGAQPVGFRLESYRSR